MQVDMWLRKFECEYMVFLSWDSVGYRVLIRLMDYRSGREGVVQYMLILS